MKGSIGIFDSGLGGLTILSSIRKLLPDYDFTYLGDNARVPYGNRSFDTVYKFTWECVSYLLQGGCPLVIVACNTASAKALRNIQQLMLPKYFPDRRVLGVIRPTTEVIDNYTKSKHIGILGTEGTVKSESYILEVKKFFPHIEVIQQACPMWVPLIENGEHLSRGSDYFVDKYLHSIISKDRAIDILILACTHYPLLLQKIQRFLPPGVTVLSQGELVAESLKDYLGRHTEIESQLTKNNSTNFLTTDDPSIFKNKAALFIEESISVKHVDVTEK